MRRESSRRLTGPNPYTHKPAALTEVVAELSEPRQAFVRAWQNEVGKLWRELGPGTPVMNVREHAHGLSLSLEAPIDLLYAAIALNDLAADRALTQGSVPEENERLASVRQMFARRNEPLVLLQAEAARRGVPFLWDDDQVSLGHGAYAQTWPTDELPVVDAIDWTSKRAIPVAFITGTNGKTTTSRMLTRIARIAGFTPGNTSSDGVCVNEELVERGDWTGSGAARTVLRRPEVNFAVLEAARGGILRRGLGVSSADAAIITNVSNDHLGDYGIDTVADMAHVKSVIGSIVKPSGRVVLGSDDATLAALDIKSLFAAPVIWFGSSADVPVVREHLRGGGEAWLLEGNMLVQRVGDASRVLLRDDEIPATYGGAARHNAMNALGAAAMASALGIDFEVIKKALRTFGASNKDNPGRTDLRVVNGVRVLLDFGHNPRALSATFDLVARLFAREPGRLFVSTGHAGDRNDEHMRDLCETIARANPHRIYVRELADLLRGRNLGELPVLFQKLFDELGVSDRVRHADDEVDMLEKTFAEARPGDVVVLTLHLQREGVEALLNERAARH